VSAPAPTAAELRSRVLEAVRREPAPPRPIKARRHALLIALGFAAAGGIALIRRGLDRTTRLPLPAGTGRRLWHVVAEGAPRTQGHLRGYVVTLEVLWVLVAIGATWVGIGRGRSMLGRSAASKLAVAALTPVALIVTWLVVALAWLETVIAAAWFEVLNDTADVQFNTSCALMSIVYAIGPLIAFFAIRHRRDPSSPRQSGAAIGAVAGAWGAVVHFPFCQCTSPLHLVLGHVLPVVVLAVVGALVGDRVLGLRASINPSWLPWRGSPTGR
jgi:hypothetical protein